MGSNFKISVSCHHFGWAFPSSGKSRVDEGRPIAFKTGFFNFSHLGQTKKTAVGSNFTISVSCHHFGWAFPSSGKSRVDEGRPIAFFPIGARRKNSLGIEFYNFGFFSTFPVRGHRGGEKTALGSNFTISVSCHHFGWAFPIGAKRKNSLGMEFYNFGFMPASSGKSRVDEGRRIPFKTRFFPFRHRGESKKQPWDRILQFRFHATILGGLFQAAEKAGFTKVVQSRSKCVLLNFPIGGKRKNSLGIEF